MFKYLKHGDGKKIKDCMGMNFMVVMDSVLQRFYSGDQNKEKRAQTIKKFIAQAGKITPKDVDNNICALIDKILDISDQEAEKEAKEKAEREKAEREKAEREKAEREKAEREKAEKEKAEKEAGAKVEKEVRATVEKEVRATVERKAEREKAEKEAEKEAKAKAERKVEREKAEKEAKEKVEKEAAEKKKQLISNIVDGYGKKCSSDLYGWLKVTCKALKELKDRYYSGKTDFAKDIESCLSNKYASDNVKISSLFKNIIYVSLEKDSDEPLFGYKSGGVAEAQKMDSSGKVKFGELGTNTLPKSIKFILLDEVKFKNKMCEMIGMRMWITNSLTSYFYDKSTKLVDVNFESLFSSKLINLVYPFVKCYRKRTRKAQLENNIFNYLKDTLVFDLDLLSSCTDLEIEY